MTLEQKLELWVKITGVNPAEEQKVYSISFNDRLNEYDIRKMNDRIKDALKYDETGLFAEAYLCHFFNEYIKKRAFHLEEYLVNPSIKEYLHDVGTLHDELRKSDAEKLISLEAAKAMSFYGLQSDKLTVFDIVEMRVCAKNCIEHNLSTLQFSSGPVSKDGFKMSKEIRMYKNLNALILSAAKGKVDGVSMAYIRDENEITHSYFSFVIKNGQNVYLLTDKPVFVHPLQGSYSRCPGRNMSERISGNMFPYGTIANLDVSDLWDSGRYGIKERGATLSSVLQNSGEERLFETIGSINQLEQVEAFWFIQMVSLIKEKFYDAEEIPTYSISYVGNQIRHPAIEVTDNAVTVQGVLPAIDMHKISFEDIENLTFGEYYEKNVKEEEMQRVQYLVERYREHISEDVLNILNSDSPLLPDKNSSKGRELSVFNITEECGTAEELNYRQRWIGRYNYAVSIKRLLCDDYDKNCTQIYGDIRRRMEARLDDIVVLFLKGELMDRTATSHRTFDHVYDGESVAIGELVTFDKWWDKYPSAKYRFGCTSHQGNKANYRCAITGGAPGVVLHIEPKTLVSLCALCGCDVSELPVFIQNWSKSRHYSGNHLLSNIDPVSYVLEEDPFNKMDFSLSIVLSKKEYLRLCDVAGVEGRKFWLEEPPLCLKNTEGCPGDWSYNWEMRKMLLKKKCTKCRFYKEGA